MSEMAIETSGLTRRFGRLTAVDGIDLRVPMGSVYGFLGRNGAGKTTTIQMLMGLIEPSGGEMSVLSFDPLRQDVAMKRVVSYVPERVQMYDWMRVREVVWFAAQAADTRRPDLRAGRAGAARVHGEHCGPAPGGGQHGLLLLAHH